MCTPEDLRPTKSIVRESPDSVEGANRAGANSLGSKTPHYPEAFKGDAHALLIAVYYKDAKLPIELRIDAAKTVNRHSNGGSSSLLVQ